MPGELENKINSCTKCKKCGCLIIPKESNFQYIYRCHASGGIRWEDGEIAISIGNQMNYIPIPDWCPLKEAAT